MPKKKRKSKARILGKPDIAKKIKEPKRVVVIPRLMSTKLMLGVLADRYYSVGKKSLARNLYSAEEHIKDVINILTVGG